MAVVRWQVGIRTPQIILIQVKVIIMTNGLTG